MGLKSREKGKVGERQACQALRELGFHDAQRTAQCNGKIGLSDVICPETLPGMHIEVKFGYDASRFGIGSQLWKEALAQCTRDSKGKPWVLLWKTKGSRQWLATFYDQATYPLTAAILTASVGGKFTTLGGDNVDKPIET